MVVLELVWPSLDFLPRYVAALERGWSPDNLRPDAGWEALAAIRQDPAQWVAQQVDRDARGADIALPNGEFVPRLPGFTLWMWDGEFCARSTSGGGQGRPSFRPTVLATSGTP